MGLLARKAPSCHTGCLFSLQGGGMEGEKDQEAWPGLPKLGRAGQNRVPGLLLWRVWWLGFCLLGLGTALCCTPVFRGGCSTVRWSLSLSVVQRERGGYFEARTCTPAGRALAAHWLSLQPTLYPPKMGIQSGVGVPRPQDVQEDSGGGPVCWPVPGGTPVSLVACRGPVCFGTAPQQSGSVMSRQQHSARLPNVSSK